jgi:leucyl-tRNA synthetase
MEHAISAYAQRLLDGLKNIDWTQSLKDAQENWIGKSVGALVTFKVLDSEETKNEIDHFLSGNEHSGHEIQVLRRVPIRFLA